MHFRTVPGTAQAAASKGFGSVFTDVDRDDTTKIEYFDVNGTLLFSGFVPPFRGNQTLSFLGVAFDAVEEVFLVRISSGDVELGGSNRGGRDLVVMDDFIDGEPHPLSMQPESSSEPHVAEKRGDLQRARPGYDHVSVEELDAGLVGSFCYHIKREASGSIPSLLDLGPPGIRMNLVMPEHHAHRAPVPRVVP